MEKMTIATKFDEVVKALNGEDSVLTTEELVDFINDRKEKALKKHGNRKPTKRQVENAEISEKLLTMLTDEPITVKDMLATFDFGEVEMTTQRLSGILTQLVKDNKVVADKSGKVNAYTVA